MNFGSALGYLLRVMQNLENALYSTDTELERIHQEEAHLRQRKALATARKEMLQKEISETQALINQEKTA
jgi:hypothetical protein